MMVIFLGGNMVLPLRAGQRNQILYYCLFSSSLTNHLASVPCQQDSQTPPLQTSRLSRMWDLSIWVQIAAYVRYMPVSDCSAVHPNIWGCCPRDSSGLHLVRESPSPNYLGLTMWSLHCTYWYPLING